MNFTKKITNNKSITIILPEYVQNLAYNFTVQITPIYNGNNENVTFYTSEVSNNSFIVYGNNTKFFWTVYGTRGVINVEPNKSDVDVKGSGPYKWI